MLFDKVKLSCIKASVTKFLGVSQWQLSPMQLQVHQHSRRNGQFEQVRQKCSANAAYKSTSVFVRCFHCRYMPIGRVNGTEYMRNGALFNDTGHGQTTRVWMLSTKARIEKERVCLPRGDRWRPCQVYQNVGFRQMIINETKLSFKECATAERASCRGQHWNQCRAKLLRINDKCLAHLFTGYIEHLDSWSTIQLHSQYSMSNRVGTKNFALQTLHHYCL